MLNWIIWNGTEIYPISKTIRLKKKQQQNKNKKKKTEDNLFENFQRNPELYLINRFHKLNILKVKYFWQLYCVLMLNWIVWNRTDFLYKNGFAIEYLMA